MLGEVQAGGLVVLLDPQARLVGLFQAPHKPAAIAEGVGRIRAFVAG